MPDLRPTAPMLATLASGPFHQEGWIYEIKWDGYRALAFTKPTALKSRNDKSFDKKFYPVFEALKSWNVNAVVDGEIVAVNSKGLPDFGLLQNWRSETDGDLLFYVFDLLWLDGKNLCELPLTERRKILEKIVPENSIVRLSEATTDNGVEFYHAAAQMGLEGIMAKKADSEYTPGYRSKNWLKIKANRRQEVVIGGYTVNTDTSKTFSSILVGVNENGKLHYMGKVGTGFNVKTQQEMMKQFIPLLTDKCPFSYTPDVNQPSRFRPDPPNARAYWLKPQLVCEVQFTELTRDGIMRHPSFEGMRIDKKAIDVILEKPMETSSVKKTPVKPLQENKAKTLVNPHENSQVKKVKGRELTFNNLDKIYWPKEKYTKRDLINYYHMIAPYMLPHLKNRPQSMNRYPNGIEGESFYQKDVTGKAPEWAETFAYYSEADQREKQYLVCTDEASLLYMASLGCIEINPWHSRVSSPDNPDWCVIDLDPDKNTFNQVIEAALVTKGILDDMGVVSYCKTSGSSGLHIYIPLGAKYSYEQSKEFARVVVTLVNHELPSYTTIERAVKSRKGKMYLDFLQNRNQATIAAPYSVRPKPGATVSMPLLWDEVKPGLKMKDFTIKNAYDRVRETGDLFKPVLGKGINLEKIVKKLG